MINEMRQENRDVPLEEIRKAVEQLKNKVEEISVKKKDSVNYSHIIFVLYAKEE